MFLSRLRAVALFANLLVLLGLGWLVMDTGPEPAPKSEVEAVHVFPALMPYYGAPGSFNIGDQFVEAPPRQARIPKALAVMKYQVSQDDYARCVADKACAAADSHGKGRVPVTGINHFDALAYARWLSGVTGQSWRLPSDLEWVYFSGLERQEPAVRTPRNWSDQWLERYSQEAQRDRPEVRRIYPQGHFGLNTFGLADIGGSVWEWTQDCFMRVGLNPAQEEVSRSDFCGIRVLQGQHRSYIPAFIRDASAGGCGVGTPPDYIGLRLVRSLRWYEALPQRIQQWL